MVLITMVGDRAMFTVVNKIHTTLMKPQAHMNLIKSNAPKKKEKIINKIVIIGSKTVKGILNKFQIKN